MPRRDYNPRLPEIRQQATLEPAVRAGQLNTYVEKRPDTVAQPDRNAGLQWGQLARALHKWEPALERFTTESAKEDAEKNYATYRDLQAQQEKLNMTFAEFTRAFPEHLGASPAAQRGWNSMRLERLGMQFDTELRQAYSDNGWVNLEKPEEYTQAKAEWVTARRKELLGETDEETLPLVDQYFTPAQLRAENNLDSYHSAERNKATLAKGQQETEELAFATIDGIVRSPHEDFFSPSTYSANIANLGAYLTNLRDRSMASGVPAHMANEWVKAALFQYAGAMALGTNDYRADMLFAALDHIPTGTGVMGGTSSSRLALAEFLEKNESRRFQTEEREYRRQAREREEGKRLQTEAIVYGLNKNPEASLEEIAEEHNIPLTADTVAQFNVYRKNLSMASEVRESPENRLLAAELAVDIREGRKTLGDGLEHLQKGHLTESQWNVIRGEAPSGPAYTGKMKRLTQDAGIQEAETFIRKAWTAALDGSLGPPDAGKRVQAHFRGETAVTLFKSAVYREIELFEKAGGTVDYYKAAEIIEKHKAALASLDNSLVTEAADKRQMDRYSFEPVQAAKDAYQTASELGHSGELSYTPSPSSPIAAAPPRALRILEHGARKAGTNPLVVYAFAKYESNFKEDASPLDPKTNQPLSSAYGYMQLIDGTAAQLGVDKRDPVQNAYGGAMYIKQIADMHKLDLSKPEDVARAYMYYHDGPGTKGEFSAQAQATGAQVAKTFAALQAETSVQQTTAAEQKAAKEHFTYLQPLLPDVFTAAAVAKAASHGHMHPALTSFTEAYKAAGLPPLSPEHVEKLAAQALGSFMTSLSKEDKHRLKLYLEGQLFRFEPSAQKPQQQE